jgi:hypothetical protein
MMKNADLFRKVTVIELSQPAEAMTTFQLIRVKGDFLDQLGFTRDSPITIFQEGNKLVILREAVDQIANDRRET